VAVFIDGCFWHGCPIHHTAARTNASYWAEKVRINAARDRDTDRRLAENGWAVARYWEHERPDDVADDVMALVRSRSGGLG
jgi:DNA mismatch endonuclease (patch repair protein)